MYRDLATLAGLLSIEPLRRAPGAFALSTLLALAGCGGGGGSSRAPAPPATPPPPTNAAPNASFQLNPGTSGPAPLTISVDGTASSDSDGNVAQFSWDFGDGSAGLIGAQAQHTYTVAGTYQVRLTVTDDEGAEGFASRSLTVTDATGTASVSGTVRILSSSAIDRDVNDRLTVAASNNSFDDAQPLPNPVTLGGFANRPNTGAASGNLFASGDPADIYRVDLTGSETIFLAVAEGDADLDLRLYDAGRNLVDASVGDNTTESLNVDAAGSYFVEVVPISGATNYSLSIGLDLANAAARPLNRLTDPFVPGQLLMSERQQRGLRLLQLRRSGSGERRSADSLSGARIMPDRSRALLAEPQMPPFPASAKATSLQRLRLETLYTVKALRGSNDWATAEVNGLRQPLLTPNDDFYDLQWHYQNVNLPLAWDVTTGSSNVIVAVIDSGVLLGHPDLNDRLIDGFDFIADAARARDGDGLDANPDDPGDLAFGGSSSFHGTHVAGTIGAETNNSSGSAGVDWSARIMPLRALGVDGGTTFDVLQAMRFAAGLSNDSGTTPPQRADIINLSLGSEFSSQTEQNTITEIRNLGVLIVASAGNESSSLPSYPAAYDGVVSVAATTISNNVAGYSNFGPTIDVAAPGGDNGTDLNGDGISDGVISTIGEDGSAGPIEFGFAALNGTSMASPHVAGIMALMKSVHPALTPAEFDAALVAGELTDDLGAPGRDDRFGWGLINAQKAVIAALELANGQGSDPGPVLTASASSLNFGAFGSQLELTLANVGTGTINVAAVTSSEPWLTIDASTASASGLGIYQLNVDRTGLADGAYSATVNVDSDANDLQVSVIMQVASASQSADAGLHFIILVDTNGESSLPAAVVSVDGGEYRFRINNVPFGQYRVFGGTDSDDDNFLCDDGEACGAFRTLDDPETISVNEDILNVDFTSVLRTSISAQGLSATPRDGNDGPAAQIGLPFLKDTADETASGVDP